MRRVPKSYLPLVLCTVTPVLAALPACGNMAANYAANVAAQQHNCPRNRVRVLRPGGHWQYWLDVCGDERLYTTMEGDYRDITYTVRGAASGASSTGGRASFDEFRARQQRERQRLEERRAVERARASIATDEFTGERRANYQTGVQWEAGERAVPTLLRLGLEPATLNGQISVTSTFGEPRWRACHSFHLLADSQPIELGEATHEGLDQQSGGRHYVAETVRASIGPGAAEQLVRAESVRGRVCNDVFSLSVESTQILRQYGARLIQERQPAPTESEPLSE